MVNRAKAAYDEEAKTTAASYSIYSEAKKKYDEMLEEYNRITSNTSSINIEYENAKSSVEKILNEIDAAKDNIKRLEEFNNNSSDVLNKAKLEYDKAVADYQAVQHGTG